MPVLLKRLMITCWIAVLLAMVSSVSLLASETGARCVIQFLKLAHRDREPLRLPLGSRVRVAVVHDGKKTRSSAFFLGLSTREDAYFFYEPKNGEIFSADMRFVQVRAGKRGAEVSGSDPSLQAPDITIPQQIWEDCAVHSTVNCVGFLEDQGLISKTHRLARMRGQLYSLFEDLDFRHYEERERQARAMNEAQGLGFWKSLFVGARAETQPKLRSRILERYDLPNRIVYSKSELLAHLRKGFPAILDVRVKEIERAETIISASGVEKLGSVRIVKPSSIEESVDGHSVVAIGYIKTGFFSKKIIVLDSYHGGISVWDPKDLKSSRNQYTLVYPNERAFSDAQN